MQRFLNRKYTAIHFLYQSMFAAMFAFASVFLLDRGFNNATIGTVLSVTSLISIGLQTMLGNLIDRHKHLKLQKVISVTLISVVVGSLLIYFTQIPFVLLLYITITFALALAVTPLINSLAYIYTRFGIKINYGFARGIGSLAYALTTVTLGYVIDAASPGLLPIFYAGAAAILLLSVRSYQLDENFEKSGISIRKEEVEEITSEKTSIEFVSEYKKLVLLLVGIIFLFFTHTIINNFFIQVITPIGGDSAMMGTAIFIGTIVELPTMLNFDRIEKRVPVEHLLKISAIFFLAKHVLTYLAPNVFVLYIAQFLQIGAFSISYPALVDYVNKIVAEEDLVRGQALLANAIALSSVFGSFLGGVFMDVIGVSQTLLLGAGTTIIGLIIVFISVESTRK